MGYRYVGHGEYCNGIPARDLSDDDVKALSKDNQAVVATSTLYEVAKAQQAEAPKAAEGKVE